MDELGLMTWNVRYFGHATRGLRSTVGNMRRIAEALASLDRLPDVLALQEVETRSLRAGLHPERQVDRFVATLDEALASRGRTYRALYYPAHRYTLPSGVALYTTGLAILVSDRVAVLDHNADAPHDITHVRLPAFARFKQRRIAGHAHLLHEPTGAEIDLFNTHLSLPAFFEVGPAIHEGMGKGSNQLEEVRALLSFVDTRRRTDRVVVVGDFNSSPGSPAYQAFSEAGLIDAFAAHHDPEVVENWSTARFGAQRMHIDHVFSSPALEWVDFAEHTASRGGPFHQLSDHAPKYGHLKVT